MLHEQFDGPIQRGRELLLCLRFDEDFFAQKWKQQLASGGGTKSAPRTKGFTVERHL